MLSPQAYKYLADILACHWSRHAFTTKYKSGMLLNNACESLNGVLREAGTNKTYHIHDGMDI